MVAAPARSEYDPAIVGAGSVGPPTADTVPFPVTWRKTPLTASQVIWFTWQIGAPRQAIP